MYSPLTQQIHGQNLTQLSQKGLFEHSGLNQESVNILGRVERMSCLDAL